MPRTTMQDASQGEGRTQKTPNQKSQNERIRHCSTWKPQTERRRHQTKKVRTQFTNSAKRERRKKISNEKTQNVDVKEAKKTEAQKQLEERQRLKKQEHVKLNPMETHTDRVQKLNSKLQNSKMDINDMPKIGPG
jgi:hypothetical protein